jgi:alcohol dehydrogenase
MERKLQNILVYKKMKLVLKLVQSSSGSCGRCEWCLEGKPMCCTEQIATGINALGSHAEYMIAFASETTILPNKISYVQAAPVFCAGYTAWGGLRIA